MTFDSATPSQGTCSQASGTVTCQLGTVGNGASATDPDQGPAAVDRHDHATRRPSRRASTTRRPANNTASASTTVNPAADLAVTKTDSPDPVAVGPAAHLHGRRQQRRARRAPPASPLTDTLPAGVTFNSATPSQGSCSQSSGTVTCSLGTLANAASASVSIKVTPQSAGTITNQANVTSLTGDPNTANNGATAQTTVNAVRQPVADQDGRARPGAGRPAAHLHPHGRQRRARRRATGVQRDRHAAGRRDLRLGHALAGHLLAGVRHRHVPARHDRQRRQRDRRRSRSRRRRTGSITNQASVTSAVADPTPPTTPRAPTTLVNPVADLSLTKTDSPDPVAGRPAAHLHARRRRTPGPRPRPACPLSDTLPAGVTFNSATPSQGTCSQASGTVTCRSARSRTARARASRSRSRRSPPGSITNQASVSSGVSRPELRQQHRERDDDRRTRPPTCR